MEAIKIIQSNLSIISLTLIFLSLVFLLLIIIIFLKIRKINANQKIFFEGKDAKSLEETVLKNSKSIISLDRDIQELYNIANQIHQLAGKGIYKTEIIRFNPFKDIGGDQSFSIALLNGKNSGLVISSMHTRENTRVYAKPIVLGKSGKYDLTEEEKNAVQNAIKADNNEISINQKEKKLK
jgi:PDZ domain-containing secreted protein